MYNKKYLFFYTSSTRRRSSLKKHKKAATNINKKGATKETSAGSSYRETSVAQKRAKEKTHILTKP